LAVTANCQIGKKVGKKIYFKKMEYFCQQQQDFKKRQKSHDKVTRGLWLQFR
jgi:hypothetical protein